MKICGLVLLAWLLSSIDLITGGVVVSPSPEAPVCQAGDKLELTCSTTGTFHRWEVTVVIPQTMTPVIVAVLTSIGPSGMPLLVMINNSTFTASRLSGPGSLPLMSRMVISPVSSALNGTVVSCFEGSVSTDSVATSTIYIIGDNINNIILNSELDVQRISEHFSSDGISVVFERNVSNVEQLLQRNVNITVVPNPAAILYSENTTFQLVLLYNTLYNVSVTQPGICGQPNQTIFIELSYSKCDSPVELIHSDVIIVVGYEDPALKGENITFTCPTGAIISGPNSSMCMESGEWEPDLRELDCIHTHELMTTATMMPNIYEQVKYCLWRHCSIFTSPHTSTGGPDPSSATAQILIAALISMICILTIASVLMLFIGFLCGLCFNQRWRKSAKRNDETPTTEPQQDLELKENVAYITIRPK